MLFLRLSLLRPCKELVKHAFAVKDRDGVFEFVGAKLCEALDHPCNVLTYKLRDEMQLDAGLCQSTPRRSNLDLPR